MPCRSISSRRCSSWSSVRPPRTSRAAVNAVAGSRSSRNGPCSASATLARHGAISTPTETSPRPRLPVGTRGPRFEVGEPGEVEDVAQLAHLLAAQHIGCGQMVPDELVLHLLQQKCRLGRRKIDGGDGVDVLVLDSLDEVRVPLRDGRGDRKRYRRMGSPCVTAARTAPSVCRSPPCAVQADRHAPAA